MHSAALAAHMRLAGLPTWGRADRSNPTDERRERARKAAETKRRDGTGRRGPAPVVLPSKTPGLPATPRVRGRSPVSRHGFRLHDLVEIVGGRYAGERGRYDGSVDVTRVFVQTKGGRRSVSARFVRGIAG